MSLKTELEISVSTWLFQVSTNQDPSGGNLDTTDLNRGDLA